MSPDTKTRLSRNVVALGVVSLLNDASSEIIYPFLPLFLTGVLGAGPAFLGVVEGIAESTASILKLLSGWWSDRVRKRKRLAFWGYLLAGGTRPFIGLASAPWQVLAIRFADRVGKGLRSAPRDALIADSTPPEARGYAFGFHRAMDHGGAVVGSLAGFALAAALAEDLRAVFLWASVPAVVAVFVLAFGAREVPPRIAEGAGAPPLRLSALPADLRRYLGVLLLFTLGNSSDAFLLLRAKEAGVEIAHLPLLWGAHHVAKMLASVPGGRLSDRVDRRAVIAAGWGVYAAVYVGFSLVGSAWGVWALFLAYGVYFGLTEGVEKALVVDLAPPERRATALGFYHLVVSVGALPASLLTGFLWQTLGPAVALGAGAGFAAVSTALLWAAVPRAAR